MVDASGCGVYVCVCVCGCEGRVSIESGEKRDWLVDRGSSGTARKRRRLSEATAASKRSHLSLLLHTASHRLASARARDPACAAGSVKPGATQSASFSAREAPDASPTGLVALSLLLLRAKESVLSVCRFAGRVARLCGRAPVSDLLLGRSAVCNHRLSLSRRTGSGYSGCGRCG